MVCVCVWMGAGRFMCMWRVQRLTSGVFITHSPLYFLRQSLSYWIWNLRIQLHWWIKKPQDPFVPTIPHSSPYLSPIPTHSTVLGLHASCMHHHTYFFFFLRFWDIELRLSHLHVKQFSWAVSPVQDWGYRLYTWVHPSASLFYLPESPLPPGEVFPKPWEDSLVAWNIQPLTICSYL